MRIKTVCGSGLGSSLLVEMNVKSVLEKNNIKYESLEHTNISNFNSRETDLLVCGIDVYEALDFPEEKTILLKNILSKTELEEKLKKKLKF